MSQTQNLESENLTIPFTIEFTNTLEELVSWHEYSLKHNINNLKYRLYALSVIPGLFSSIYLLLITEKRDYIISGIIGLTVFTVSLFPCYLLFKQIWKYRAKKNAKVSRAFKEKQTITFSEEEITTQIESASSTLKYNFFLDLSEGENNLYLRISKISASVWPKKYFSEEQIEFIKSIITLRASLNKNL